MAALLLKSYRTEQRAFVRFFCGLKDIMHMLFTVECVQWLSSFWPDEENAGWTKICFRYGGAVGHSSVACAAADFDFFASGIHKLVERWDWCLNKLGGYVEKWIHDAKRVYIWSFKRVKNYSYLFNLSNLLIQKYNILRQLQFMLTTVNNEIAARLHPGKIPHY